MPIYSGEQLPPFPLEACSSMVSAPFLLLWGSWRGAVLGRGEGLITSVSFR